MSHAHRHFRALTPLTNLCAGLALTLSACAVSLALESQNTPPAAAPAAPAEASPARERLLIFSKTASFRHDSIPDGIECLRTIFGSRYDIDASEDSTVFSAENLKRYRCVIFLSTTGDILDASQQAAFETFIHQGGAFVGIHAAADTEHTWPWYGKLVGAYFKTHPKPQESTITVEDRTHRSTRMLPQRWTRFDEWYVYDHNPRSEVKVLASLDDATVEGSNMDGDHPIAWYHEFEGGRAWYTGGGHTKESYKEPLFQSHVEGGVLWAVNAAESPTSPVPPAAQPSPRAQTPSARRQAAPAPSGTGLKDATSVK